MKRSLGTGLSAISLAVSTACASDVQVLRDHSSLSSGKDAGPTRDEDSATGSGGAAATPSASGGSTEAPSPGPGPSGFPPTDLYVMLDQSSSMGDPVVGSNSTWWILATDALRAFFRDPSVAGTGVGLQYFPLDGIAPASCAAPYATPDVEIGTVPSNVAALSASLEMHSPVGFTPTAPALRGALQHMKAWAPAHPGRVPAVVFVTDGFPTECDPVTLEDIARIAASGVASAPVVRTFVVGLNLGAGSANLDGIAAAGGTGHAVAIDDDVSANVIRTLSRIVAGTDGG